MNAPRVLDVGAIVARNAVPVFGLIFLGWKAAELVLLYYIDTLLAIAAVFALLFIHGKDMPVVKGWRDILAVPFAFLVLVGVFGLVFAWPLVVVVDDVMESLYDRQFQGAILGQLLAAVMWFATWNRNLRGRDDREELLRKRFGYVTMCWVAVFAGVMFVPWPPALVVIYAGASIWFEVKPPK